MAFLRGMSVVRAIDLHGQQCFVAKEIQHVFAHGMFPAEFVSAQPPVTQPAPDQLLRWRREESRVFGPESWLVFQRVVFA